MSVNPEGPVNFRFNDPGNNDSLYLDLSIDKATKFGVV